MSRLLFDQRRRLSRRNELAERALNILKFEQRIYDV
jgi:hypothetical protein